MGGIIAGFLKGAGQGAAMAGQMMLADKLANERDEANFLRDSQLQKSIARDRQAYLTQSDATKASALVTAADTRNTNAIAAAETDVEAKKNAAKTLSEAQLNRDQKKPKTAKNPMTVKIDNGQGQVVDYVRNEDGSFSPPNIKDSSKDITITTDNAAKASADWETYKKTVDGGLWTNDKDVEKATGMKKAEWLAQRGLEHQTGVAKPLGGSAPPELIAKPKDETAAAPAGAPKTGDELYSQMIEKGGDPAKVKQAIIDSGRYPNWTGQSSSLNPISSANASSGLAEDKRNAPAGPPVTEDVLDKRNAPVGGPPVSTQNLDSKPSGVVNSQRPVNRAEIATEEPIIPPAQEAESKPESTGFQLGSGEGGIGYAEANAKQVQKLESKVSGLEQDLAIAEKVLDEKGGAGRTGKARKGKVANLKKEIATAQRAIDTLSE